jgi:hypothetical protein
MYKTEPVTFWSKYSPTPASTSTIVLGTSSFVDTVTAPYIVTNLGTGTHKIYATWPGEGLFAAQSTQFYPFDVSVDASVDIGGELAVTVSPSSGNLVVSEGTATITAFLTTTTAVTNELKFYVDNIQIGTALMSNNRASVSIDSLAAGTRKISVEWPGATINSTIYGGKTAQLDYLVLRGQTVGQALTLAASPSALIVDEGTLTLTANISTSTSLGGTVSFYNGATLLGDVNFNSTNTAVLTATNTFAVGTANFSAAWNGNQTSSPKYIEKTSNTATVTIVERRTIPSMTFTAAPNPAVNSFDNVTFTAVLNTNTSVSGLVRFFEGSTFIASANIGSNRTATVTLPASGTQFSTGTHVYYASYAGSTTAPKYYPVTSNNFTLTVTAGFIYTGTITLAASRPVVHQFTPLTLTATASAGTYTGVVNFDSSVIDTREEVFQGTVYNYPIYLYQGGSSGGGRFINLEYSSDYNPQNFFTTGTIVKIQAIADYTNIPNYPIAAGDIGYYEVFDVDYFNNAGSLPDYTFNLRLSTGTEFYFGGSAPIEYTNNLIISYGDFGGNSQFGELTAERLLNAGNFNGTSSSSYTFVPAETISGSTQTHYFEAVWLGGYKNGITPHIGTSSNIISVQIVPATINLRDTTSTNVITRSNTYYATVNTSTLTPVVLSLKNGSTVLSTATTVGSTATFTLAAGALSTGTRNLVAEYSNAINTIQSNPFTQTIINKLTPTVSVTSSTYSFYNKNRTSNSVTTATITVQGTGAGPNPTGVVTLLDVNSGRLLGTANLTGSNQTSTATITWSPTDQAQIDQGTRTLRADYYSDDWYIDGDGSNSFVASTKANISPTLSVSQETIYWTNTTTFTMSLDGALVDGSISLKEGSTILSVGTVNGNTATFTAQRFSTGTHFVFANLSNDTYVKDVNTNIIQITSNAIVTSFDNFAATWSQSSTIGQINWNLNPLSSVASEFIIDRNITIKIYYRLNAPNNVGPDVQGPLWNTFIVPYTDTVNAFDMPSSYNDGTQLRNVRGYHFEVIYEGGGACPGTSKIGYVSSTGTLYLE